LNFFDGRSQKTVELPKNKVVIFPSPIQPGRLNSFQTEINNFNVLI